MWAEDRACEYVAVYLFRRVYEGYFEAKSDLYFVSMIL